MFTQGHYPPWCCQKCGDAIGYVGIVFTRLRIPMIAHVCAKKERILVDKEGVAYPPVTEVKLRGKKK